MKFNKFYDEKTQELKVWKIFFTIVFCVVVLSVVTFVVKWAFFPVKTAADIVETVFDSDNIIYNYEWFYNRYQSIQARKAQVNTATQSYGTWRDSVGETKDWKYSEREENARLLNIVEGLKLNLNEMIADYNAKASMVTRDIFRGRDLPEKVQQILDWKEVLK